MFRKPASLRRRVICFVSGVSVGPTWETQLQRRRRGEHIKTSCRKYRRKADGRAKKGFYLFPLIRGFPNAEDLTRAIETFDLVVCAELRSRYR